MLYALLESIDLMLIEGHRSISRTLRRLYLDIANWISMYSRHAIGMQASQRLYMYGRLGKKVH